MTAELATTLNGVDLGAVGGLVGNIRDDASQANTSWQVQVDWKGGFASEARVRDFAPIASDEPIELGGRNGAPNPVEQLLGALGNCLAVGYAANATLAGITLNDLRIDLDGDVDLHVFLGLAEGHAGFTGITAQVSIDSDATPAQLEDLHAKVIASSPVGHTLTSSVGVDVSWTSS